MEMILHLTNLKPFPQGSVVPTVLNICPVVLEKNIVKHQTKLSTFPLKAYLAFNLNNPFPRKFFVPSLVESGQVVLR